MFELFLPNVIVNHIFDIYIDQNFSILENQVYHTTFEEFKYVTVETYIKDENLKKHTYFTLNGKLNHYIVHSMKVYYYKNELFKKQVFDTKGKLICTANYEKLQLKNIYYQDTNIYSVGENMFKYLNYKGSRLDGKSYVYIDRKLSLEYTYKNFSIIQYIEYKENTIERIYNFKDGKFDGNSFLFDTQNIIKCKDDYILEVCDLQNVSIIKFSKKKYGQEQKIDLENVNNLFLKYENVRKIIDEKRGSPLYFGGIQAFTGAAGMMGATGPVPIIDKSKNKNNLSLFKELYQTYCDIFPLAQYKYN